MGISAGREMISEEGGVSMPVRFRDCSSWLSTMMCFSLGHLVIKSFERFLQWMSTWGWAGRDGG